MDKRESLSPRLARLQAQTGVIIAVFVTLHLSTALSALFGPGRYDAVQRVVRYVYQNPVCEVVLLGAIVVHVIAGIRRMRLRTKADKITLRVRLHRYAGYFLAFFVVGHVAATRLPAVLYDIHVGAAALAYSLNRIPAYFYPYYALLALSGLYHLVFGLPVALGLLGVRVPASLRKGPALNVPVALLGVGLVLALFALGGHLYGIPDPFDNGFARLGESLMN